MCGRMTLTLPFGELEEILSISIPADYRERYNMCPGQQVLAVRKLPSGKTQADYMKWGLIPSWAKDPSIGNKMINARAETVNSKPSFRTSFRTRRALIVANGFFEWLKLDSGKQPFYIIPSQEKFFGFAGLWDHWKSDDGTTVESCTVITTEANDFIRRFHNRMPAILDPSEFSLWLDPEVKEPEKLLPLLRPCRSEKMIAYPVPSLVNYPKNEGPEVIKRVE